MTYAQNVGERLRNIRLQKGLSLHDVELASSKEFKASVLGAYERGERSISRGTSTGTTSSRLPSARGTA
jgi:transcriptional regulator with XRE-family HTH domain